MLDIYKRHTEDKAVVEFGFYKILCVITLWRE